VTERGKPDHFTGLSKTKHWGGGGGRKKSRVLREVVIPWGSTQKRVKAKGEPHCKTRKVNR